jgi:hypothetical protein
MLHILGNFKIMFLPGIFKTWLQPYNILPVNNQTLPLISMDLIVRNVYQGVLLAIIFKVIAQVVIPA